MSGPDRTWLERRRYPRIPVMVVVRVALTGQGFTAETTNISAGGVLLNTDHKLPAGTHVDLRIEVPALTQYPIRAAGEVVRVIADEPAGLAIRFTSIAEDDRELLVELAQVEASES